MTATRAQVMAIVLTVVTAAVIVWAVVLVGGPATARLRRLDAERLQHLSSIAGAVDLYWTRRNALPASLDALEEERGIHVMRDPGSGAAYEYRPTGARSYELCAAFALDSAAAGAAGDPFWSHGAGRQCFSREAERLR